MARTGHIGTRRRFTKPGTYTPVASVSLSPASFTVATNGTQQLLATPKDSGANPLANRVVNWGSNNTAIATVTAQGIVTGLSGGNCTITATCESRQATSAATVPVSATQLVFVVQPTGTGPNTSITPAPQVAARDGSNNTVSTFTGSITLALGANPGGATLGGVLTVAAVNGIATFSNLTLSATGAGYTLVATSGSLTSATSSAFTITGGVTPWLLEDFSSPLYTNTPALIADPRGIYSVGEDVFSVGEIILDPTVGFGSSTKSMKYTWPDRTGSGTRCNDYTIGRNLTLPNPVPELWLEVVAMFSANWTPFAPSGWSCASGVSYKFLFGRVPVSRYNVEEAQGIYPGDWLLGYPGNEQAREFAIGSNGSFANPWDGAWHTYRVHLKNGAGTGRMVVAMDGVTVWDSGAITANNGDIYGIALGRNLNQGPDHVMSMWYGRIAVYNTNPGWGI